MYFDVMFIVTMFDIDNIFTIQSYAKNTFQMDDKMIFQALQLPSELEYVPWRDSSANVLVALFLCPTSYFIPESSFLVSSRFGSVIHWRRQCLSANCRIMSGILSLIFSLPRSSARISALYALLQIITLFFLLERYGEHECNSMLYLFVLSPILLILACLVFFTKHLSWFFLVMLNRT